MPMVSPPWNFSPYAVDCPELYVFPPVPAFFFNAKGVWNMPHTRGAKQQQNNNKLFFFLLEKIKKGGGGGMQYLIKRLGKNYNLIVFFFFSRFFFFFFFFKFEKKRKKKTNVAPTVLASHPRTLALGTKIERHYPNTDSP